MYRGKAWKTKRFPYKIRRAGFARPRKTGSFKALADGTYLFILLPYNLKACLQVTGSARNYSHFQLTAYLFFSLPFCIFAHPKGKPSTQTSVQPSFPSPSTVSPFR